MKAILKTRCGCSKMIDIPEVKPDWNVALHRAWLSPMFTGGDFSDFPKWEPPERRRFILADIEKFDGEEIALYIEIT